MQQLAQAQASVAAVTNQVQNREAVRAEHLAHLGQQLQQAVRAQHDSIARVAGELSTVSKVRRQCGIKRGFGFWSV